MGERERLALKVDALLRGGAGVKATVVSMQCGDALIRIPVEVFEAEIAALVLSEVEREREACAKVCAAHAASRPMPPLRDGLEATMRHSRAVQAAEECAAAIRARREGGSK